MNNRLLGFAVGMSTMLIWGYSLAAEGGDTGVSAEPTLEEVVVTANRREENLQKAAIAIDAVSADSMLDHGIHSATDLGKIVPSLSIETGGGNNGSVHIRGVGTRSNNAYLDSAVALSYDGVYLGRSSAATATSFYDLERIEVLKGPQGILYGRNATGGAINIIPAHPNTDELSGFGLLAAGSYSERQIQGTVNIPLNANSALRIAGNSYKHDGYNRDGSMDADSLGVRAQYLIKPSDTLSVRFGVDYTKQGGVGAGPTMVGSYANTSAGYVFTPSGLPDDEGTNTARANAYRSTQLGAPGFGFLIPLQDTPYNDYKYDGISAEINLTTGIGTWTFIPAWRKTEGSSKFTQAGFNTGWIQDTNTQSTFEARLASSTDAKVDYIGGLYYFKEKSDSNNTYNQEFVLPLQLYTHNTQSYAAFGQLTFHASDQLRFVTGARYTNDKKDMNGVIDNFIVFCGGLPPTTPPASFALGCAVPGNLPHYPTLDTPQQGFAYLTANGWINPATVYTGLNQVFPLLNRKGVVQHATTSVIDGGSSSRVTWKASVQYDVAPESLLYFTYETGYRGGGFQLADGTPRYKPEFLDAASIGSKNRFLGDRLQVNAEVFWWKYKDQQINYFTLSPAGTLVNSTQNVGRSTNKGVDVDLLFAATANTQLSARVSYLSATYDDLHFVTAAPRDNFGCPFTFTGGTAGGQPVKDFNCSGKPAIFSPKYTVNVGIDHTFPLGRLDLVASAFSSWRDDQWAAIEYIQHEFVKAYSTTDVSLELRSHVSKWSVVASARNLEDKGRIQTATAAPTGQGMANFGAARTYGLRVQSSF